MGYEPGDLRRPRPSDPGGSPQGEPRKSGEPTPSVQSSGSPGGGDQAQGPLPSLSLPKAGGAIRGMGEKFAVNPATGTGSLTVPIAVSPGRSGFGPELSLSYDSGAGNGPFGLGWHLAVPAITRKTDKGLPRYLDADESDVFILSGAEDLVPQLDAADARIRTRRVVHGVAYDVHPYRPRIEGLFARIERWVAVDTGESHWRSISRDNVTTLYGLVPASRIASPSDPLRVFSYLICRTFDDKGNVAVYEHVAEDATGVDITQAHEANRTDAERGVQRYLARIRYGNATPYFPDWSETGAEAPLPSSFHFEVVLDYGDHSPDVPTPAPDRPWATRPDPFSSCRAGFEVRTYRRCQRILVFHHFAAEQAVGRDCLVRSTDLAYQDQISPADPRSPLYTFVASITQTGYRRSGSGYIKRSLPPLELEYSRAEVQADISTLDRESLAGLPEGIDGARYQWVDLDGEGASGILTDHGGGWGYKRNLSPLDEVARDDGTLAARASFGPVEPVRAIPSRSELGGGQQLLDLAGSGRLSVVAFDQPLPGFFERTLDEDFEPFRPFASLPRIAWSDPNLKFIDLTGDGLADVLITEHGVLRFYPSLGRTGFGEDELVRTPWDEERGPEVVLSDGVETLSLADMSGDGLSDLVRIRNGEICYWPNLGYGRFGAKVTMDRAPRFADEERFDPRRLRLADIDRSGTTDLLYIGADGVLVCFNQSGNTWSEPHRLAVFPAADGLSSVRVMDLLGNGTACLVWSSPLPGIPGGPLHYVDLMGGQKPHLLLRSRNNFGAETRLRYAPSTRFYLADKLAGTPWITHLPHVVQVVARVETYDYVGRSRFVSRYTYHHGYFDGFEREFRGFGMVEQWDTEEHGDTTDFPEAEAANWDRASWSPPKLTRTWFHTGAFFQAGALSRQYAHEYWTEPALRGDDRAADRTAMELPDSLLPEGLSPDEIREALRALKGMTLRSEVFAQDGSARAANPYSVTEQNFTVKRLQPMGQNRHACFLAHSREKITCDYERRPDDPRVTHELTLEMDDFGNVLRSVSVGYPRRPGHAPSEPTLSPAFQAMLAYDQGRLRIVATEHRFTNSVGTGSTAPDGSPLPVGDLRLLLDAHRTPAPSESIVAELIGLSPMGAQVGVTNLFRFDEVDRGWRTVWDGAHDVSSEEIPGPDVDAQGALPGVPSRRFVEQTRMLYRSDDLTALLPLDRLEPSALPGQTYHRALTPGHVTRIFGDLVSDAMLAEGGYVHLPGSPDWWIPSGRVFYSPGDGDTPAAELAEARAHFQLPRRAVDPFGAISRVAYDAYDLLPASAVDAVGNTTSAASDYRVLAPVLVTDANGNRGQVAFDALGLVAGTAVMGKTTERLGDSLAGFEPDLDPAVLLAHLADPLANPGAVLGEASSRVIYDLFAYQRTRAQVQPVPMIVYTLARETHLSDLAVGQVSRYQHTYSYTDGLGREVQKKAQAAPGPVPEVAGTVTPRWIGSGWTIFNNKGKPVRTYEPFFSATHGVELAKQVGVSTVVFYDPAGRTVATLHPDNTWEKVVFDNWRQETWDANDTVLVADPRTDADVGDHFVRLLGAGAGAFTSWYQQRIGGAWGDDPPAAKRAAEKTEPHAATPAVAHFDALGRTCLAVADNGAEGRYPTHTARDTRGKPLAVSDALGRRVHEYCLREHGDDGGVRFVAGLDLAGNALYQNGGDGGARRSLLNAAGNPIRGWDARGLMMRTEYDPLHRPLRMYVQPRGGAETLAERIVYGEAEAGGGAAANRRGHKILDYDGAGELSLSSYDFKGSLTTITRRLAVTYRQSPDWSALAALTDAGAVKAAAAPLLEAEPFTSTTGYDALDRPVRSTAPDGSTTVPTYDEAGKLQRLDVRRRGATTATPFVGRLEHDAKGRRVRLEHGNGTITTYEYDALTFALTRQITTRASDQRRLQDFALTYDPVHNIAEIDDNADPTLYFSGSVPVAGGGLYEYDAVYRLASATGREHPGQQMPDRNDAPLASLPHPNDTQAMRAYVELFTYDPVGNILKVQHLAGSAGWTRRYQYAADNNRLLRTSLPGDADTGPYSAVYEHDAAGNLTRMPHLPAVGWDHDNRMASADLGGGGTAYYTYDATGKRVRKVIERLGTRVEERIYLGGYEIYRQRSGAEADRERQTLHVMDDKRRVAMVETLTIDGGAAVAEPAPRVRYQLGDHLGSTSVEVDDSGQVIAYEEYFPFGASSFHSAVGGLEVSGKRYRYTGKERDDETGLYYYGARYYAPWLGRWTSVDPAGMVDGPNRYEYAKNRPGHPARPDGTTKQAKRNKRWRGHPRGRRARVVRPPRPVEWVQQLVVL